MKLVSSFNNDAMMTESNFVQPTIPKFDGHYDHWSMLKENFLPSKEYWSLVETGIHAEADESNLTDEQKKTIAHQRLKDLKAKNYLFQAIDRSINPGDDIEERYCKRHPGLLEAEVPRHSTR